MSNTDDFENDGFDEEVEDEVQDDVELEEEEAPVEDDVEPDVDEEAAEAERIALEEADAAADALALEEALANQDDEDDDEVIDVEIPNGAERAGFVKVEGGWKALPHDHPNSLANQAKANNEAIRARAAQWASAEDIEAVIEANVPGDDA